MKKYIFQLISLAVVFFMASCDPENVDLTPPSMEVVSFAPTPEAAEICGSQEPVVFQLTGGDELTFDVIFNDDIALSQYKVDIHNNFDCHGHGGGSAPSISVPNVSSQTTDWSVLDVTNLSETSSSITRTLNVPENVTTGNYHFQIQVLDESGNDNPAANFFALKIKNPTDNTPPQISVQEPTSGNFSAKKGETIRFAGQVTDDRSLSDGGNGVLFLSYTDLSSENTFSTDAFFVFDETVDKTFDFDFEFTIPVTLTNGRYRFSLGANDGVRNVADFQFFEVEVTN